MYERRRVLVIAWEVTLGRQIMNELQRVSLVDTGYLP